MIQNKRVEQMKEKVIFVIEDMAMFAFFFAMLFQMLLCKLVGRKS